MSLYTGSYQQSGDNEGLALTIDGDEGEEGVNSPLSLTKERILASDLLNLHYDLYFHGAGAGEGRLPNHDDQPSWQTQIRVQAAHTHTHTISYTRDVKIID